MEVEELKIASPTLAYYSPSQARERFRTTQEKYLASITQHKNEYWRMKCFCEIQKKRKTRDNMKSFELLNKWHQYDRWESKSLMAVDWQQFYEELTHEEKKKKETIEYLQKLLTHPIFFAAGFIVLFCIMFLFISLFC